MIHPKKMIRILFHIQDHHRHHQNHVQDLPAVLLHPPILPDLNRPPHHAPDLVQPHLFTVWLKESREQTPGPDPVHMILDPEAGVVDHSLGAVHHSTILVQDLGTVKGQFQSHLSVANDEDQLD